MTAQTQPMKLRNQFGKDKDNEFSRNGSANDPYDSSKVRSGAAKMRSNEEVRSRIPIKSDKSESEIDAEIHPQKQNQKLPLNPANKFDSQGERFNSQSEDQEDSDNEHHISPEQRLQKSPPEDYASVKQRQKNSKQEDSMKMEDVLGEFENEDIPEMHGKNKNEGNNYGGKGGNYAFGEHENSNFGTEWMSEK
jgi:hypothetical protein